MTRSENRMWQLILTGSSEWSTPNVQVYLPVSSSEFKDLSIQSLLYFSTIWFLFPFVSYSKPFTIPTHPSDFIIYPPREKSTLFLRLVLTFLTSRRIHLQIPFWPFLLWSCFWGSVFTQTIQETRPRFSPTSFHLYHQSRTIVSSIPSDPVS